ncbi:uncharacterized protein [Tenebrio molitor]|uniref:uncharacterized protein n=1 Tax=Tenebrio molitor TaxID=7067 RepID=UPI0036247FA9
MFNVKASHNIKRTTTDTVRNDDMKRPKRLGLSAIGDPDGEEQIIQAILKSPPRRSMPCELFDASNSQTSDSNSSTTPADETSPPLHTHINVCTDDAEWSKLEQAMEAPAEALEKAQELRHLINEKFRLLDEAILPLTKSGSKFVSVGIQPFRDYEPVIKMYNPTLTAAVTLDRREFDEFVEKMAHTETKTRDPESTLFRTNRYEVIVKKNDILQFKPLFNDVYQPLFLKYDTIMSLIKMKEFFVDMLVQRGLKQKELPHYDQLVTSVALHLLESDDGWDTDKKIENGVFSVIRETYKNEPAFWEMCLKTPTTLKVHIKRRCNYFAEYNIYN